MDRSEHRGRSPWSEVEILRIFEVVIPSSRNERSTTQRGKKVAGLGADKGSRNTLEVSGETTMGGREGVCMREVKAV
jgi:hypothetical protein